MREPRSVVITGASRGLGLASAAHLYNLGWRVVGAMRSPDVGLERLRAATGAADDDRRLIGVRLDLEDSQSIEAAARCIEKEVGAPDALVHNAGIAAVAAAEEMPFDVWEQLFRTNLFGPVRLTKELLPSMRGSGRGRIIVVSSQGGIRGMPAISAYSAAKGALERWAEALAAEIAPFGLGVTVLVTGTFKTDIITEQTPHHGDMNGPYATHYTSIDRNGRAMIGLLAQPPERFAAKLASAVDERAPFARHAVGLDAHLLRIGARVLPGWLLHHAIRPAMGLPRHGTLRGQPRDPVRPSTETLPPEEEPDG